MYFRMDPADYLQAQVAGDVVAWSTAIPMACRISAMLIAACRCRVACRGGWSAMTGYTNFAACRSSPGGHLEHGVTDCYTLFRDAYHLAGIEMPDFARREDWWKQGIICIWITRRRQAFTG